MSHMLWSLSLFFFKIYLFILERERQRQHEWEAQRERESQADSPMSTEPHDPEIMTRVEIKSQTPNQPSHPGAPHQFLIGTIRVKLAQ